MLSSRPRQKDRKEKDHEREKKGKRKKRRLPTSLPGVLPTRHQQKKKRGMELLPSPVFLPLARRILKKKKKKRITFPSKLITLLLIFLVAKERKKGEKERKKGSRKELKYLISYLSYDKHVSISNLPADNRKEEGKKKEGGRFRLLVRVCKCVLKQTTALLPCGLHGWRKEWKEKKNNPATSHFV